MHDAAHIKYYHDVYQGSEQWHALRCGVLTASQMCKIINKNLEPIKPKKEEPKKEKQETAFFEEMLAQRISSYVEPQFITDAMLRGHDDEIYAKEEYAKHYAKIENVGFVTNNKYGFVLGCSPDGLVGKDGMIEVKSRAQRFQIATIRSGKMPDEYYIQVQTALLVLERKWCDFISYSGGLPMMTLRIKADPSAQARIIVAAMDFDAKLNEALSEYNSITSSGTKKLRLIPTPRRIATDIIC
jgi:hypothetical protein